MSTFNINGKSYSGNNINVVNGKIIIDGKIQEIDKNLPEINIIVHGDIQIMDIDSCNTIEVHGNVKELQTTSGDINVTGNVEGNSSSTSGNIEIEGYVSGHAKTVSGDIKCNELKGNASSVSGKIHVKNNSGTINM